MSGNFSYKNSIPSNEGAESFGLSRFLVTALLIFFVIGLTGLFQVAYGQDGPVFWGTSPPVAGSRGTLLLKEDLANEKEFHWKSADSILGTIDTGFVTTTKWNYFAGSGTRPARLVFVGSGDGATFYGNVIFGDYNRAVVDVTKYSKRVRYLLKVPIVDLDGDGDHDGTVEDNAEDDDPENNLPGIITLANVDDDDEDGNKDNEGLEANTVDDSPTNKDFEDLSEIIIRRIPGIPAGSSVTLTLHTPTNVASGIGAGDVVRIFSAKAAGATAIMGPGTTTFTLPEDVAHNVDLVALRVGDIKLGVEGLEFAGEVKLKLEIKDPAGKIIGADEIQLKVAPLIFLGHLEVPIRSFVSEIKPFLYLKILRTNQPYCNVDFPNATPIANDHIIPGPMLSFALNGTNDPWAQDEFQIGFQQAPYKSMYVVLDSKRDRDPGLKDFPGKSSASTPPGLLGPDFGHIQVSDGNSPNSLDSFGNLEVTPPLEVGGKDYPFGRIYYGDGGAAGRQMDADLRAFLSRQQVQSPIPLNSDWLNVGHVDEFMSIVPDTTGTHGWKVLIADPCLSVNILGGGGGQPGVDEKLHIPRYIDFGATIDTVESLLKRLLDEAVPGGSATIRSYNLHEVDEILFGPPAAEHNGGLKAEIRNAFGLANTDFISVPVLFNRVPGKAVAITPGLANGAVYPGVYIAPDNFLHNFGVGVVEEDTNSNFMLDPGEDLNGNGKLDTLRDPFHVYMNSVMPGGVTTIYIDDWDVYHLGEGEVHCSSNEIRDIPTNNWWD